jgi:hypothetical protein
MPVVINEFEVVTESPPPSPASGATSDTPAPVSKVQQAVELSRQLSRQRERQSRVRAH